MLALPYLSTYSYGGIGSPRTYYDYGEFNKFKIFGNLTNIALAIFVVMLLGQLTYFVNLFVGLYKRMGSENNR
jgi:hypothetical protein